MIYPGFRGDLEASKLRHPLIGYIPDSFFEENKYEGEYVLETLLTSYSDLLSRSSIDILQSDLLDRHVHATMDGFQYNQRFGTLIKFSTRIIAKFGYHLSYTKESWSVSRFVSLVRLGDRLVLIHKSMVYPSVQLRYTSLEEAVWGN